MRDFTAQKFHILSIGTFVFGTRMRNHGRTLREQIPNCFEHADLDAVETHSVALKRFFLLIGNLGNSN